MLASALASVASAEVVLSWSDNSDNEEGFNIERSVDGGAFVEIGQTGPDVSTFIDAAVEPGVDYEYRVNAFNAFGVSGFTNVASYYLNLAPSISSLASVAIEENESTAPLAVAIGDAETAASELTLSGSSSNTALIDASGFAFSGLGSERAVSLTPKTNASGQALITLTVSDGEAVATTQFTLTVDAFVLPTVGLEVDTFAATARAGEAFGLAAVVSESSLVTSVSFSIDGAIVGSDASAPFEIDAMVAQEGEVLVRATASVADRSETVVAEKLVLVGPAPLDAELVDLLRTHSTDGASGVGSAEYDLLSDSMSLVDDIGRIAGTSDTHRYQYAMASGDVDVSARLVDLQTSSSGTVAGLMLRSALYGNAAQVSLLIDGEGRVVLRHRAERAAVASSQVLAQASAGIEQIRINKLGTSVFLWGASVNGSWASLGQLELDWGEQSFVGLALAAGLAEGSATATFDLVEIVGTLLEWSSDASAPNLPSGLIISSSGG